MSSHLAPGTHSPSHIGRHVPVNCKTFAYVPPLSLRSSDWPLEDRIWNAVSTSQTAGKLGSVPHWLISHPQLRFTEYSMCSHVTCDPCPSPQVPWGPCFLWSPLAPPLLHGLVSTATQVLLLEGLQACSHVAVPNNVPSARWPQLWGWGREGHGPLLPASGKGLSANSACWIASLTPWACVGMLQRCPLSRSPSAPSAATALLPLVTQLVSVQDPKGHGQDRPWASCLLEAEGEEKVNLALARSPPAGMVGNPLW